MIWWLPFNEIADVLFLDSVNMYSLLKVDVNILNINTVEIAKTDYFQSLFAATHKMTLIVCSGWTFIMWTTINHHFDIFDVHFHIIVLSLNHQQYTSIIYTDPGLPREMK